VLAATLTLAACGGSSTTGAGQGAATSSSSAGSTHSSTSPSSSSTASASVMATPAPGPHNGADAMFATMMIPHHAQAVKMSEVLLAKDGIDPQVTDLANKIKAAQGPEIEQMRGWLAGWKQLVPGSDGSTPDDHSMGANHGGMNGMMSTKDMTKLEAAKGEQASRLFLTAMIAHHRGAIAMARTELARGTNPEAKKLAQTIIDAQQAEITTMSKLLAA
jgi:uncharacterized protein (DUF305 family)